MTPTAHASVVHAPTPRRWLRRAVVGAAIAVLPVHAFALTAHHDEAGAPPHSHGGELAGGLAATLSAEVPATFWITPFYACTGAPSITSISAPASCDDVEPFTWTLEIDDVGQQLRVDFDQAFRQDDVVLTVTDPDGSSTSHASSNTYSGGVRVDDPIPGTWTVELAPVRTDGTKVRMRAGLVSDASSSDDMLLPNLRVTPPFEFGFVAPASPLNPLFLAGDDQNPPLTIGGESVNSCAVDEVVEAGDATRQDDPVLLTRCLRFTTGPHNVGAGHFDVRFPIVDRALADQDRIEEMTQFVHHADGSTTEREAGTYEYHVTHAHWHYLDILFYEAWEVTDLEAGTLTSAGVGRKSGFCPADQGYGAWTTFEQGPRGAVGEQQGASCFATSGNGAMGLSQGWGDFYRWQRSGQYIDFRAWATASTSSAQRSTSSRTSWRKTRPTTAATRCSASRATTSSSPSAATAPTRGTPRPSSRPTTVLRPRTAPAGRRSRSSRQSKDRTTTPPPRRTTPRS